MLARSDYIKRRALKYHCFALPDLPSFTFTWLRSSAPSFSYVWVGVRVLNEVDVTRGEHDRPLQGQHVLIRHGPNLIKVLGAYSGA